MSSNSLRVGFVFPGQGSYHYPILRELYDSYSEARSDFELADETCRRFFGVGFLPLVTAANQTQHDSVLNTFPDLDQIGIYLTEVILAELLARRGLRPSLTAGHSFGDLAALTTAGVFDKGCGLKIVCQRVLALQAITVEGRMAAVSCNTERTRELIEQLGTRSLEISVLNHPGQTVVSGFPAELNALRDLAASKGVSITILKSRYPFHSSLLGRAVNLFRTNLRSYQFQVPSIPVYICTERRLVSPDCDIPDLLSKQFVKKLDFMGLVNDLANQQCSYFVECGAGDTVSKLLSKNIPEKQDIVAEPLAVPGQGVRPGMERIFASAHERKLVPCSSPAADPRQLIGELETKIREAAELIQSTRAALEHIQLGTVQAMGVGASKRPNEVSEAVGTQEGLKVYQREEFREAPVAIVSLGCVLPGAANPEEYWRNIVEGVSGIIDLAEHDPQARHDFIGGSPDKIVSDKSYSLLNGSILETPYDADLLSDSFSEQEFGCLSRGQRILGLAIAQALRSLRQRATANLSIRVQCILGATGDGSEEYDEAVFADNLYARLARVEKQESTRRAFAKLLEKATGFRRGDSSAIAQHDMYCKVVDRIFGRRIKTYVVDTACSSSLYSIDLAIKSLLDSDTDLVLAGGVFAPGPANNTLFAQFRGLTPDGSRPLDATANGVVFGDGAGIVVLKRLPEALKDGDNILAVIRGVGLSSDGRSASINVPQASGQKLAIERAYEASGVAIGTIQYVEAHATATPVGDATEFTGLNEVFGQRNSDSPRIELGSVKSLIGHTGWASGVASVIKFCLAFRHRTIPKQHFYSVPNPAINLEKSPFAIATETREWPENVQNLPRRVGINSFGFGGTNAHLILEEFDRPFHESMCGRLEKVESRNLSVAIVGFGCLFPGQSGLESEAPCGRLHFDPTAFRLPARKMLLPDVREHMDASQYLASLAAEKVLAGLTETWTQLKTEIGVVLGLSSKTERGVRADERIFLDRFRRRITERNGDDDSLSKEQVTRLLETLCREIETTIIPSGPYTLPGLMPNVAASRISSLFDLKGPNLVIDCGRDSLFQTVLTAERLLAHDNCRMVLAGGLNGTGGPEGLWAENAFILGLTTVETAREAGFPVLGLLTVSTAEDAAGDDVVELKPVDGFDYRGAQGAPQILKALELVGLRESALLRAIGAASAAGKAIHFAPNHKVEKEIIVESTPSAATSSPTTKPTGAYAFVQGTPIYTMTPRLFPVSSLASGVSLNQKRVAILTDQKDWWKSVEHSGALIGFACQVICPAGAGVHGAIQVDVGAEKSAEVSLRSFDAGSFDAIVVLKNLAGRSAKGWLENDLEQEIGLAELLFAVTKHCYQRIAEGSISVSSVCLNAFDGEQLDPYTGLIAGFMKSLVRELPRARCSVVNLDDTNLLRALRCTEVELGQEAFAGEVSFRKGDRYVFRLQSVDELAVDQRGLLTPDSVVIATGGGRGVTAALCETLLERFGCTIVALGRTTVAGVPEQILGMTEEQYRAFEGEFYRAELLRDPRQQITELRKRYWSYQAANELQQVIKRLSSLGGSFEYHALDITDAGAVDEIVRGVYDRYGRVDLVLHGAGIQVSKIIPKKTIEVFQKVVTTKLASLRFLYRACHQRSNGSPVHFHLLTSAFSYLGNDGQPDYGAANEAMNRIADAMSVAEPDACWSSMAWLGWAGIGMTRGTEFAALAANRRLRGVTKEEGKKIFGRLLAGRPATPVNVLMADGEIKFYRAELAPPTPGRAKPAPLKPRSLVEEMEFTVENSPYLLDHLVHGVPTLPGAFIIGIVADFVRKLRPELKIAAFEQTEFAKFVSVFRNKGIRIRLDGRVVSENEDDTLIHVRVLSDFTHKSGIVLQKDVMHTELFVRMAGRVARQPQQSIDLNGSEGLAVPDPYVMPESPVRLSGKFNSLRKLFVGESHRIADYQLNDYSYGESPYLYLLPNVILVDAFWRFGTVEVKPDRSLSVFVPRKCEIMKVFFDYTDFGHRALNGAFTFWGTNPRVEGDLLHVGPIEVRNEMGEVQLIVEGGLCHRFGTIHPTVS